MPRRLSNPFPSVRTEGGLLPAETLQRIAAGEAASGNRNALSALTPASYHLPPGERLNEAISRSWSRLVAAWASFRAAREKLPPTDAGTTLTRERWLLPLFAELGYGRLPTARPVAAGGRDYAVSHLWQKSPIHLVSFRAGLDQKAPGVSGASRSSPHSLVQELLNRSDEYLWGFASNGLVLRLLRDNASLSRQAYVEFDLAAMMEGELYSDFTLLWLLAHVSRVEAEKPEQCHLEAWTKAAREEGLRALDTLRVGVEEALGVLGRGFLEEPANAALHDRLASGALPVQDYYRQLLRLVYRLLFLLVAEDRGLLFPPASTPLARERYLRFFSLSRLRSLAASRRGSRHGDLWAGLVLVMRKLGSDCGCADLALPALGGFLYSDEAMPDLAGASLANAALLEAVRKVALTERDRYLRPVDFRNLGAEELGSVYESLLELHPVLHAEGRGSFELRSAAGSERKTTGSYYTPTSLIECLLDSALNPVLDEAARAPDPEKALLALRVCDPACGSGHFLIAAAHRIARRLASARTGEEEPDPSATRTALRDVIGRCLYGVDLNPMAAELCRVALWIEALEPGKPLSFLDHHIQVGNSLLGTTPALLASGIPDEAFTPIEGDDRAACSAWKKRNKSERQQMGLAEAANEPWEAVRHLATERAGLDATPDASPDGIRAKEERWRRLLASDDYTRSRLLADAWCAAFVWRKTSDPNAPQPVTEETFRRLATSPASVPEAVRQEVVRLREQYQFFHWHLAFPEVFRVPAKGEKAERRETGWSKGFDVLLCNPPWERVKIEEKAWFETRAAHVVEAATADRRKDLISRLRADQPELLHAFRQALRRAEGIGTLLSARGLFPLGAVGDLNTFSVFAELCLRLSSLGGRAGFVAPTSLATDYTYQDFFSHLMTHDLLRRLVDFSNKKSVFPDVDSNLKFSLFTLGRGQEASRFCFGLVDPDQARHRENDVSISMGDVLLVNPNTSTCPAFLTSVDAALIKHIYRATPVLKRDSSPPDGEWDLDMWTMFHMANDSRLFVETARETVSEFPDLLRLYEGKMIQQFDHRFSHAGKPAKKSGVRGTADHISDEEKRDPSCLASSRYGVPGSDVRNRANGNAWFLGYREIGGAVANVRTMVASVVPYVGVGNKIVLMAAKREETRALLACLLANLNAFIYDYVLRQKMTGTSLSSYIVKQIPAVPWPVFLRSTPWLEGIPLGPWITRRVLELAYTAWDLKAFAEDCGWSGPPFRWDLERRALIRCELDAAFFHLCLPSAGDGTWLPATSEAGEDLAKLRGFLPTPREAVSHVMDCFPIVRRRDEDTHGSFRTKHLILEIYDELQRAIDVGEPFVSRLDPPPGDPRAAHGAA